MATFRLVEKKDFGTISQLYGDYIDFKNRFPELGYVGKKLSDRELIDLYEGKKKGEDALPVSKINPPPPKVGWVAEIDGRVLIYYQWAYKNNEAMCEISIWPDDRPDIDIIAEELLIYCFDELKKMGMIKAIGAVSDRMRKNRKYDFFRKYITEIVEYPDSNHSYQRRL